MDTCFLRSLLASIGILILLIASSILIYNCVYNYKYIDWQDVSVPLVGKFKVPPDWVVTQMEDTVYLTDKSIDEEGYKIYLVGIIVPRADHVVYPYELFEDTRKIGDGPGIGLSNSARYGQEEYIINGKKETKYYLDIGSSSGGRKKLYFLAWDDLIDEKTLSKIAYSFDAVKSQSPPKS